MSTNVAAFTGSLRTESFTTKLVKAFRDRAPDGVLVSIVDIGELPLLNEDLEKNLPQPVRNLHESIDRADAILLATPEYNRSVSGVLKNAIDHASRPYGQSAWKGKPAGMIGASIGAPGTSMAQQHLRNILAYLDVPTLGQPEAFIHVKDGFFDPGGDIANSETKRFLQGWMDRYVAWVKSLVQR